MNEELKIKYQKILNQLNQINQDLIFYDKDFSLLKEALNQYVQVNDVYYGKDICDEIQKNIKESIQILNQEIISSLIQKL